MLLLFFCIILPYGANNTSVDQIQEDFLCSAFVFFPLF